jgi:hypothetical protein
METDDIPFDAVSQIIHSEHSCLCDLLSEGTTFAFAKSRHPDLSDLYISFSDTSLKRVIPEIIDLCFSDPDDPRGIRAFLLFTRPNPALLQELLKNRFFFTKVSSILFAPAPDVRLVSRASVLLCQLITTIPAPGSALCGFVVKLVDFAYEPIVAQLFERICHPRAPSSPILHALRCGNWAQMFVRRLRAPADLRQAAALLRTVRIAAANPMLAEGFRSPAIFQVFVDFLVCPSEEIQDELWGAIAATVCRTNVARANAFIEPAIAQFTPLPKRAGRPQIFAVEFLAQMLQLRAVAAGATLDRNLKHAIVGLVDGFPNASELMGATFRFITAALMWELTMPSTIGTFVPIAIAEAALKTHTAASAKAKMLLSELHKERATFPQLDKALREIGLFDNFYKVHLAQYTKVLSQSYGNPEKGESQASAGRIPQQRPS